MSGFLALFLDPAWLFITCSIETKNGVGLGMRLVGFSMLQEVWVHRSSYKLANIFNCKIPCTGYYSSLQKAKTSLEMDLKISKVNGFHYGVKLVRGAYMQERKKGDEGPIWPNKKGTDSCYHSLVDLLLQEVKKGSVQVMVATHNEQTVKEVTAK